MRRILVPYTIEDAGSAGNFFTDKMVFKTLLCFAIALGLNVFLYRFLDVLFPNILALIISIIPSFVIFTFLFRRFGVGEKTLKKLFRKMKKPVIDVSDFSDIFHIDDRSIAHHENGSICAYVGIIKGTYLGRTDGEVIAFEDAVRKFKNTLLGNGYLLKEYNLDVCQDDFDVLNAQVRNCAKTKRENLRNNLDIKNSFLKAFVNTKGEAELMVYCVVSDSTDINTFEMRLTQVVQEFKCSYLKDVYIMNNFEIQSFGKTYFDVIYFNPIEDDKEDVEEALTLLDM